MKPAAQSARAIWLSATDAVLLRDCSVDTYRASGPGGQKRNKTDSAVRLRHKPSGLDVVANESRSQHENKARALKRLRMAIALSVRQPLDPESNPRLQIAPYKTASGGIEISPRHSDYPQAVAVTLDILSQCGGAMRDSAEMLGISTAQLSKWISKDDKFLAAANAIRRSNDLRPL